MRGFFRLTLFGEIEISLNHGIDRHVETAYFYSVIVLFIHVIKFLIKKPTPYTLN